MFVFIIICIILVLIIGGKNLKETDKPNAEKNTNKNIYKDKKEIKKLEDKSDNQIRFEKPKSNNMTSSVTYCEVIFARDGVSYYYLLRDKDIKMGDFVVVPVHRENEEKVAKVVSVKEYAYTKTPYPLNKTKSVIRKYTDLDFDLLKKDYKTMRLYRNL